jgi:multidrug efflux pump subunit AcrA (membrane-fusion protein)
VAVIQGVRGKSVYVVDAGNRAALRAVEVVYTTGDEVVVTGLAPGERVIVDGRQNVRTGAAVAERSATVESVKGAKRVEGAASAPHAAASSVP